MPSPRHDAIVQLFRDRPELAVEVLRDLAGVDIPTAGQVRLESNDFNDRPSKDFRPDTVITDGPASQPIHGIIVEAQQEHDESKRRQLPRYAAALWLMLGCRVTVLCVCPDRRAAARYSEAIKTTLPGYVFRAVVLGPDDVPVITDAEEAAAHPDLAAMGVMMHGLHPPVVEAFVDSLERVKPDHAPKYYEYAYSMAAPAVRRLLEELVSSATWPVYSPFAKEHFGRGKEEGFAEGRVEGRAEGREEGRAEGREEGLAQGEADAILTVLAARKITVADEARARITGCTDVRQLKIWLERAVVVTSAGELFD